MKLKTNTLAALAAISSLAAVGLPGQSKAADVLWDPVQQVTGTSNVIATNTGLSVAYGTGGAIVNGVTFAEGSLSGNTQNGISMSISGFSDIQRSTYTTNLADAIINGRVPSGMNELLRGGANNTGAAATVTLSGLTSGQEYAVQFLVADYRNESGAWGFIPRHETITSVNISGQLNYLNNTTGPASYVIGRFTADGSPQVFTFTPNESAQLNAIAVVPILASEAPSFTAPVIGAITDTTADASAELANAAATVTIYRATSDYGTNLGDWQTNGTATALGSQSVGPVSGPLSGLSIDTSYVVRFHAVNTVPDPDLEAWSNPVSFSTALTGKSVADLAATPFSAYEIDLTWTDNFDTETGYVIQRSPAGAETWSTVANAAANAQSHTDVHTGLLPATSYDYRVLALNATGESDPSNTATATTATATPIGTDVLVNFDGSVSGSAYTLATGETDVTGTFKANGSPGVTSGLATINSGAGGGTAGFDFNPTSIGDLRTRNWVAEALITFESFAGFVPTAISVQDVDFRVNTTQTALEAVYYNTIADVGQTTPLPTLGTRVHLALVWDASTGTLNGYVDGNPIGPVNGGAFEAPDPTNVSYGYFGRAGFDNRGIDGILDAVSFRSGTAAFNPATDFAILPGSSSFGGWITGFGIAPEKLGFNADPDTDGIPNGVEAFFGTNPNSPGTGIGSVATTGTITTFTHPQADPQLDDVTASYEWSTDLVNWYDGDGADSPGGGLTVSVPAVIPVAGVSTVTATASQPVPRLFLRVRAEM